MRVMTDYEIKRLAKAIISEVLENDFLLRKIASYGQSQGKGCNRLVTAKQAAQMLGISVSHLYHIKDDENGMPRFSYTKVGGGKQGVLRFNAGTLMREYEQYCNN